MKQQKYDILIVGGGISGAMAGIAAARMGARCLLAEEYGFLGGMLTAGGVGPMMTFHSGDVQVVRGVCGELIERMKKKGASPGHIPDTTGYTYTVTPFDAEGMKETLEEMYLEAGGEVLYHTKAAAVRTEGQRITAITAANKAGLTQLEAGVLIDATGDGDLCAWAGVPMDTGRPSDGKNMPLTMNLKLGNVDIPRVRAYMRAHLDQFTHLDENNVSLLDRAARLSVSGFHREFRRALAAGRVISVRRDLLFFETGTEGQVIVNTASVSDCDPTDPWALSKAETLGRQRALQLARFMAEEIPGFEHAHVLQTGQAIGVRSSRRLRGRYCLTAEDILTGKRFADAVAYGGYPVDVPPPGGRDDAEHARQMRQIRHLSGGEIYGVPYRCLLNDKIENLITVGRCISASFEAQGAIRVTPIAGAVGHAGGIAAALAAAQGVPPAELSPEEIRAKLKEQGAFLLPADRSGRGEEHEADI